MGRFGWTGLAAAAALALAGSGVRADIDLSKLETKNVRILYYDPIQTYLTPYIARSYENSLLFQKKLFGWQPWEKTTVYLRDLADDGIATVRATPSDALTIDVGPVATTFETFSPGERFFTLMNHEPVHLATLDVWNDDDAFWRRLFHGKPLPVTAHPETIVYNYLAQPRTDVPRWYLEGSAVFMETWMGGGLGRAQGGYDEMVFRAMVRDHAHFYDPLGLESEGNAVDFQVGANSYLYGTRFDSYLALTYGPEKLVQWLRRDKDSKAYYADQFEYVFGRPIRDVWRDWIAWEQTWQAANLKSVSAYPTTPVTRLYPTALGSVSRTFYDAKSDSLIAGFRAPGVLANIGMLSLKDGSRRTLARLKGPALYRVTSLAYDEADGIVFYTADNNAFRDLMQVDLKTGESRQLLNDARIGDLAFNTTDKSIWGVRHINGLSTLVRITPGHDDFNQVLTLPYGRDMYDVDISPDGTLLSATISEINGDTRLDVYRLADLRAGTVKPVATLTLGQSIPEGGAFSPDGKYVYATAYYTGVSNVYRLDIATGKFDAMTNATTGFFRPIPMKDGSLIVYEFTGGGFQPVRIQPKPLADLGNVKFLGTEIAQKHPVVTTWGVGSPANVPIDALVTDRGTYIPSHEMALSGLYPVIEGYKGLAAYGGHIIFSDPMEFNHLSATMAWSPASNIPGLEQLHADITYETLNWTISAWHNRADFYDLFGPTIRSRRGEALETEYRKNLLYDPPRRLDFTANLNLYSGLDTLPGAQNIQSNDANIASGKMGLRYEDTDKSLGAVDYEEGLIANIVAINDIAHGRNYPKLHGGFDFGFALPWDHASIWLYNAAGVSAGERNNVLDYFFLGAFGNNFVDDRSIKRYRDYDAFPGFGIDAIAARKFAKSTLEFNFPPVRFEDVGNSAFYLSSLRSSLFGGMLFATPGNNRAQTLGDVGFQLDWNFTIAERLPMTFSIGDSLGFEHGKAYRNEIMASLKIL